ncbi:MAG: glycosyltransferase family 4 protein [Acidobacteriota bacterium]|nr:glycosyltransferase family 4 protein [Acidobacteriota bacterium]
MRVLLVTGAYFPEISSGGLQSRAVAALLRDRVHFQVLTTSTDPRLPSHGVVDGLRVTRVGINVKNRFSVGFATVRMVAELLRIVPHVDIIHVQGYSSKNIVIMALARLLSRKVILHLQTARHDEPESVFAQGWLAAWAYSSADLYLSVSSGLAQQFLGAGLPESRLRLAPNGVDHQRFCPADARQKAELRERLGLPPHLPIILFVGVFSHDKQPHVLFEAWRRIQASKDPRLASVLVLVGSTSPRQFEAEPLLAERIRLEASQAGLQDRLVVVPPTNHVEAFFRAADVYAMPSLREGLPIALLEAMSCGLPCIASHLPGATDDVVDHGCDGLLVPVGNVDAWVASLTSLLMDVDTARRMGAAARLKVEARFTFAHVSTRWLAAYQDVGPAR